MSTLDFDPENADTQRILRALAEDAARAGGKVAQRYFATDLGVWLKADRSEVSEADEDAQAAVIACIRARRHDDAIIAEEHLSSAERLPAPSDGLLCWVVDPIDGTRNYVRHMPIYTCSVAAMLGGFPLVGAIYDPQGDVMYSASRSSGLFINGELQRTRYTDGIAHSGIHPKPVVAIPSSPTGESADLAHRWLDRYVCRSLGSTALHLALVATGQLEGMLADNPRLWDLAAGWVLVNATGGVMTTPAGKPRFPINVGSYESQELPAVAAQASVYDKLLSP